jgi:hypothetical protein
MRLPYARLVTENILAKRYPKEAGKTWIKKLLIDRMQPRQAAANTSPAQSRIKVRRRDS